MASFPPDLATFALARPRIQGFEGFMLKPYLCPANKWTIGWGTTRYPNGDRVKETDFPEGITPGFANTCLNYAMARVRLSLQPCLTHIPTVPQAAALICLAYNVGVGVHDGVKGDLADSTLLAKLNAGDIGAAADHFLDWVYIHKDGKAVKLDGLVKRRQIERALFLQAA
jgi:lysozyme